ncbi:MAG: T9SS type B sorting domain-containing protein [Flavobacterium sp.]
MKYFAAILLLLYTSYKAAAQNDCVDAITVCGSMNYTGLHATGFGVQELVNTNPCASFENNSIWFRLKIKDSGTLGFILTPESTDIFVDYDFWIFGPDVSCGALGNPIRCSTTNPFTSGGTDNLTGMNATETDEHEGPNFLGNQFIKQMDVLEGEEYYLIVDRPHGDANFSIQWTGTATFFEAPYFDNPMNISLDMGVCDTDGQTDGHFLYDLTIHRTMLIGTQTGVALTYHLDSGDAITGDNPIPNPQAYTTVADPQVIHMRMTNTVTGCYTTQTFTIDTVRPDFENPQNIDLNLHACDDDGLIDEKHIFNLAQHQAIFLGNRPHVSVKYYENEANAYAQVNPVLVTSPYINGVNPQAFYIRLDDALTGCYNVQRFTMTVHPLPVFNNPNNISLDLNICDQDGTPDGLTNFDLTEHWPMLTGGDFNLFIKYYETLGGAQNDIGQITNSFWFLNTSPQQTIYMRLENMNTGCFVIGSFQINVLLPPTYNNPQNINLNLEACDNGVFEGISTFNLTTHAAMLINGRPNHIIKYYREDWEAQWNFNLIANPAAFTNTTFPQTIYMRLENTVTGCFSVRPFTITPLPAPMFNNPQNISLNLTACDDDGTQDGRHLFDLTQHEAMLKGSQQNAVFTYHTTVAEAQSGNAPIANPLTYLSQPASQTIFVRMADSVTGCYNTTQFTLTVHPLPQIENPQNISFGLKACDIDGTEDGFTTFNLATHASTQVGSQQNVSISYFESAAAAGSNTGIIANPTVYTNTQNPQTIYMRIDNTVTGCYTITNFEIEVLPLPTYNNPQNISLNLDSCDNGSFEGVAVFDLTTHAAMLINGRAGLSIKYYRTQLEADGDIGAISTPSAFANTQNPQAIHMRLEDAATGCYRILPFTITAVAAPVFNNPQNIIVNLAACDDDGTTDSLHLFDLTQHEAMFIGSQQNVVVTYHTTINNAESGTAPIPNPASYMSTASPQTIFIRMEDTVTGCYNTLSFTLTVHPLPQFHNPQALNLDLTGCDQDSDGFAIFNLTTHRQLLTGGQATNVITYHLTGADAAAGTNAIANPQAYTNTTGPQTIFMRLTDTATGCHTTGSFTLNIILPPVFQNPQNISLDLETCDDASADGAAQFDLTTHRNMLIGGQAGAALTYHLTSAEAHAGTNAINNPSAYTNTVNPQTIYMRLADTSTGCYTATQFSLKVNALPIFRNPQNVLVDLEECDADNIDDQSYIFNLNKHVAMLRGNQPNIAVTFHTNATDAASGNSAVQNPSAFCNTGNPQTVYMRFANTITGCFAVHPFTVTVVELLDAGNPDDLYLCDEHGTGQNTFNLSQNDAAMKNGQANTTVSYYRTQPDAQNRANRLPSLYQNSQPYVQQTIWARLDNAGGCWGHDIKPFTLNIMQLPDIAFTFTVKDFTFDRNAITINIANPENYMYSLDDVIYQDSPVFENLAAGLYRVYIRSRNECKTVDEEVVILNYPKFFSPNHDGYNETWHIPFISHFPKSKIYILDRYGKLITGYTGMHTGWDGTYNGNRLPATDYWFILELEDGRIIKGHFSLIR